MSYLGDEKKHGPLSLQYFTTQRFRAIVLSQKFNKFQNEKIYNHKIHDSVF